MLIPLIVACALFMENLDSTAIATALPVIAAAFGESPVRLSLAITSYLFALAVFIPIGWGERQPYHPWRPVNFLTDKTQRDPVSDQTNLKTLLCRVSRAGGGLS